jgi:hypothetical protein
MAETTGQTMNAEMFQIMKQSMKATHHRHGRTDERCSETIGENSAAWFTRALCQAE